MRKLVFGCILMTLTFSNVYAWEIPSEINDLIIGPYVAQNDASFKKVNVQAGEECLVYSDGTSVVIQEDRGGEVLVELNASLVFKENFEDEKGNRPVINLYKEHSIRDNDLCPRGTMVLFDKKELRELHDIKSLHVEDYSLADRAVTLAAELSSIGIPEQQPGLILGYYTAQNSARQLKNFIKAGESCAVIAKGSDLHVSSLRAEGMADVRYHHDLVFMYKDTAGASQKVNHYTVFKKHNTDLCPDGTLLSIPLAVLDEWSASEITRVSWESGNSFASNFYDQRGLH